MEDNKTQLIINARVIDGAGQAPFDGAIAVQGNRILSVGAELVFVRQPAQARGCGCRWRHSPAWINR